LLLATGRTPNVDGLNVAAAGIEHTRDGIAVDAHLRTSNKKVYAIGGAVAGGSGASLAATHTQAQAAVRHALFRRGGANGATIPRVACTDPELAHVGLTERQMRQDRRPFRVLRWPYRENDKAKAERRPKGHVKVITSERGKILGVTVVGDQAGELISAWALAVNEGVHADGLADLAFPHPTYAEIGKQAAANFLPPSLLRILLRRIRALRASRR
jgi:pyruvate/2-oxoglutarate dehydrogenase complex dihydrolipoamide dehydrogenase (E3) component